MAMNAMPKIRKDLDTVVSLSGSGRRRAGVRLMGAVLIGDIDRAGIYTGLIRDRVDVQPFQKHLLSGNFGLISLPKGLRKHMVVGEGIEV